MTHRSPIFELADQHVEASALLSPMRCTYLGNGINQDKWDDLSLAGSQKGAALDRESLNKLNALVPIDEIDRVAKKVMQERLETSLLMHDTDEVHLIWSVLYSPASSVRGIFELMPHNNDQDFANIAARLATVDSIFDSWVSKISTLASAGKSVAQRQVSGVVKQLKSHANNGYADMAKRFDPEGKYPDIHSSALLAQAASAKLATYLNDVYLPQANPVDAVGADRYAIWARYFTGADLNLRETYEWGIQDLKRINDRMWSIAEKIKPGAKTLREVADHLDQDPKYFIKDKEGIVAFLQDFTDKTTERMNGQYFEIDERIKKCDVKYAPEGGGTAPYYNAPSEDLTRPGSTWIPSQGTEGFTWWHLISTWYHEAVPGHHLQLGTKAIEKDRLSRYQRTSASISGYSEGWALYAERFMDELGAFDEPGIEMGYLSNQALRAARVVVDIGIHLGYTDENGNVWNADSVKDVLFEKALQGDAIAASERDRYLGLPGQAISYKVGERVWMTAREDAKARLDADFDLKKFHTYALRLGPMGLDPFAEEMSAWDGK